MAFVPIKVISHQTAITPHQSRPGIRLPASRMFSHGIMIVLAFLSVFPIVWMIATAFTSPASVLAGQIFDGGFTLENFAYIFSAIPLTDMMLNSLVMAVSITIAQLLIAIFASYGFAVFQFRGKKLLYLLFVGSWLVPFQVTMIPNYVLIAELGLLNTVMGIVVPNLCSAFAVIMLRQHILGVPRELLEASTMDGRGSWGTLWHVVIPNLRAAIASLAVILFISAWNEYLWPILVMQQETSVVQVGIRSFLGAEGNNWGAVMAASGVACLPVFLLYVLLQKQVVDGFVRSGIK